VREGEGELEAAVRRAVEDSAPSCSENADGEMSSESKSGISDVDEVMGDGDDGPGSRRLSLPPAFQRLGMEAEPKWMAGNPQYKNRKKRGVKSSREDELQRGRSVGTGLGHSARYGSLSLSQERFRGTEEYHEDRPNAPDMFMMQARGDLVPGDDVAWRHRQPRFGGNGMSSLAGDPRFMPAMDGMMRQGHHKARRQEEIHRHTFYVHDSQTLVCPLDTTSRPSLRHNDTNLRSNPRSSNPQKSAPSTNPQRLGE
jgi:transcription factor STE12